jgi:hypothetical protein
LHFSHKSALKSPETPRAVNGQIGAKKIGEAGQNSSGNEKGFKTP